jgi:hypothetical protein
MSDLKKIPKEYWTPKHTTITKEAKPAMTHP